MVLQDESQLEIIVNQKDEIQIAIQAVRDNTLTDKVDAAVVETLSPVIEQQLDPESYESTSYSIDIDYDGTHSKSYYEQLIHADADDTPGASITAVYDQYEHEALQEAQAVASASRAAAETNGFYIEAHLDMNVKHAKDRIKLVSITTWHLMYDGKLIFN